ncbi:MAG TPA: peptidyl-prolyl cis-trans isomerase [Candidatus Eisenbacteria bacterium]
MSATERRAWKLVCVGLLASLPALAQAPPGRAPRAGTKAPAPDSIVATVGGRAIGRAELEARYESSRAAYRARAGSDLAEEFVPIARRQILEGLIRRELLLLEAPRRGMAVSEQEAEQEVKRDPFFQERGQFSQARFDAIRTTQPAQFQAAIRQIKEKLAGRKLQEQLNRELAPPEAELRAGAERSLARAAVSFLALRRRDFSGLYPEPRESEVIAEYRAHAARYRLPDRARLTLAFLNTPPPTDSVRADPAALRAWTARMRARADQALAAIRGGVSLENATPAFGVPRRDVVVTRENFPGYWRADERLNGLLFAQAAGSVLMEPVPADLGWLLARVEEVSPAHVAPLADVAPAIRSELRDRALRRTEDAALRSLYAGMRDSLRTTGYRVRYAVLDTAAVDPGEPDAAAIERYYRSHLAEYSVFDAATTSVKQRPLAEVKDEVRRRWMRERRLEVARDLALRLEAAWRKGVRDRAIESRIPLLRDVGPVAIGAAADTGAAGRAVGDSLARRGGVLGVGAGPGPRGRLVFQVYEAVPAYVPTFEQARGRVAALRQSESEREDERAARAMFDRDPVRFAAGGVVRFTRVIVAPADILDVPLTREEVERYHQEHIDRYSAPETVRARHILVSPAGPGPEEDAKARARAQELLRRIRAGEDFATLARLYSEDPATRESGGDLGDFARGVMLENVERAAFALRAGETSDLVKSEVGYHILQCMHREPAVAQPLVWMYANVASDAAIDKAKVAARRRADSLYLEAPTAERMRAAAQKLNLFMTPMEHRVGDRRGLPQLVEALTRLETMRPGQMYPGPVEIPSGELAFFWVDSILPPGPPDWEEAKDRAIEAYRLARGRRAVDAKSAELDSLERAGATLDSLGGMWGGLEKLDQLERGKGLPGLGGVAEVDSLVFGTGRAAPLAPGHASGWLDLEAAAVRLRVDRRAAPDPVEVTSRVERARRDELDKRLYAYFDGLKRRYPVRILDRALRDVAPPAPREP